MNEELLRALVDDAPENRVRREAWIRSLDPEVRAWAERWDVFETGMRTRVSAALPDNESLVLYFLERTGRTGDLTDGERARLADARPAVERAIAQVPALESVFDRLAGDARLFDTCWSESFASIDVPTSSRDVPALPSTGERPARVGPDRPALPGNRRPSPVRRIAVRFLTAAVVVAFGIVTTLIARRDADWVTETADSQMRILTLDDGTMVRLHTGSTLSYDPSAESDRRVRLSGRAYFDVTHDGSRFTVETPNALTTVLGTTFAVSSDDSGTEVVLLSGRVAVSPVGRPGDLVLLAPGERTFVSEDQASITTEPVDVASALEWTGILIFRSTPMHRVADRLHDAYGVTVHVDDRLASEEVSGSFLPEQRVEEVLGLLAETLGARIEHADGGVLIVSPR